MPETRKEDPSFLLNGDPEERSPGSDSLVQRPKKKTHLFL
jgi:hypothetical protein